MNTIQSLLEKIQTEILNPIISLLFVAATIVFIWGVIQFVVGSKGNPQQLEKGRQVMIWGIVGMFVMVSAWGIIKLLCNFFGTCE